MVEKRTYSESKQKTEKGVTEYKVSQNKLEEVKEVTAELSVECLVNLGNFSSVRLFASRKGNDREELTELIGDDLRSLKAKFESLHSELYN